MTKKGGLLPQELSSWLVPLIAQLLLFMLLGGMAASVDTKVLRERFRKSAGIVVGLSMQFILLPIVGFGCAKVFDLEPIFGISLLAVCSSPGGAYSNWWCSVFNADLALSIAMTTCSTIVSMAFTPLNLMLYTRAAYGTVPNLDIAKMFSSIGVAVFAILSGLFVSHYRPNWRSRCNVFGNVAGIFLIVFSAAVSSSDDPIWDKDGTFYLAVAAPCAFALAGSFGIGMFLPCISSQEAVAVTVETGYQNTGLALTIALATFSEEDRGRAAGVPLYYGFVQVICLPVFLMIAWRAGLTYAPRRAWLHEIVLKDFQPSESPSVAPQPAESESEQEQEQPMQEPVAAYSSEQEPEEAEVPEPGLHSPEQSPSMVIAATEDARFPEATHFIVMRPSLAVFETATSWNVIDHLKAGDVVEAVGPCLEVDGSSMQPVAPRGAVDLAFLKPHHAQPPGTGSTAASSSAQGEEATPVPVESQGSSGTVGTQGAPQPVPIGEASHIRDSLSTARDSLSTASSSKETQVAESVKVPDLPEQLARELAGAALAQELATSELGEPPQLNLNSAEEDVEAQRGRASDSDDDVEGALHRENSPGLSHISTGGETPRGHQDPPKFADQRVDSTNSLRTEVLPDKSPAASDAEEEPRKTSFTDNRRKNSSAPTSPLARQHQEHLAARARELLGPKSPKAASPMEPLSTPKRGPLRPRSGRYLSPLPEGRSTSRGTSSGQPPTDTMTTPRRAMLLSPLPEQEQGPADSAETSAPMQTTPGQLVSPRPEEQEQGEGA